MSLTQREFARSCSEAAKVLRCVTPDEFRNWAARAKTAYPKNELSVLQLFCDDCLLSYELQQREQGTCARPNSGWKENHGEHDMGPG